MLSLPTKGVAPSVDKHNVRLDIFCDWIEASVLFDQEEVSKTDIIDTLCEEYVYREQDFAAERVSNAWTELRRRHLSIHETRPFRISSSRITPTATWQNAIAHSFCLLLTLAEWHREWAKPFGNDYTDQGELFELLTMKSMETQFPHWVAYNTGWSRSHSTTLKEIVQEITDRLGDSEGDVHKWAVKSAKDAGLDLLLYRPFPDERVGVPVYLVQCSSGADWKTKLHKPDMKIWTKVIDFAATPRKAFSTPYAFEDQEFLRNCNLVDGMLLDRYRLLAASKINQQWLSESLRERIVTWAAPRIEKLPRREADS